MNVVHLSTRDTAGGAARAAYRLHRGLREGDVDSCMFVRDEESGDETVLEFVPRRESVFSRIKHKVKRRWLNRRFQKYKSTRPNGLEIFSQAWTVQGEQVAEKLPEANVYNLHWIRGFIDPLPFFQAVDQPVVWTLHDMNAFTGGCHYNVGCRRFEELCGQCPQLGSNDDNDLSRSVWKRKKKAYRHALEIGTLHLIAPSEWLAREARKSSLLSEAPIQVIPNGLDQETFRPRDTAGLYTALGIPSDHRIILFVAQSAQNRRKGFDLLVRAVSSLEENDVTLLSIGEEKPDLDTALSHTHLGVISSNLLLSIFYSLADLFVIPSRQDNLPNTVLESMACGTPVVGFDTGGIPDMVRPGETGWLAEVGNVRALRESIEQALSDEEKRDRMGKRCREVVEGEYTLEVQARRYRDLYAELVRGNADESQ